MVMERKSEFELRMKQEEFLLIVNNYIRSMFDVFKIVFRWRVAFKFYSIFMYRKGSSCKNF